MGVIHLLGTKHFFRCLFLYHSAVYIGLVWQPIRALFKCVPFPTGRVDLPLGSSVSTCCVPAPVLREGGVREPYHHICVSEKQWIMMKILFYNYACLANSPNSLSYLVIEMCLPLKCLPPGPPPGSRQTKEQVWEPKWLLGPEWQDGVTVRKWYAQLAAWQVYRRYSLKISPNMLMGPLWQTLVAS